MTGGVLGNIADLYEFPSHVWIFHIVSQLIRTVCGNLCGMSGHVAGGNLKGTSGHRRRLYLAVGLQYLILSIALGKLAGSLAYFFCGMAAE